MIGISNIYRFICGFYLEGMGVVGICVERCV